MTNKQRFFALQSCYLYCSLYLFEKVLIYIVLTSFGSANIMDMKSSTITLHEWFEEFA